MSSIPGPPGRGGVGEEPQAEMLLGRPEPAVRSTTALLNPQMRVCSWGSLSSVRSPPAPTRHQDPEKGGTMAALDPGSQAGWADGPMGPFWRGSDSGRRTHVTSILGLPPLRLGLASGRGSGFRRLCSQRKAGERAAG